MPIPSTPDEAGAQATEMAVIKIPMAMLTQLSDILQMAKEKAQSDIDNDGSQEAAEGAGTPPAVTPKDDGTAGLAEEIEAMSRRRAR